MLLAATLFPSRYDIKQYFLGFTIRFAVQCEKNFVSCGVFFIIFPRNSDEKIDLRVDLKAKLKNPQGHIGERLEDEHIRNSRQSDFFFMLSVSVFFTHMEARREFYKTDM